MKKTLLVVALSLTGCVRWTPPSISPISTGSCRSASLQWLAPDDAREALADDRMVVGDQDADLTWLHRLRLS